MGYRVAVVGATGAVGREILKTLAERNFPVSEVAAVASGRSAGQEVSASATSRCSRCKNLDNVRLHRLGHRPVQPRRGGLAPSTRRARRRRAAS